MILFNASSSYDPDGNITKYNWYFGDGSESSGSAVSHSYAGGGDFTVKLVVRDDDNLTALTETTVKVKNFDLRIDHIEVVQVLLADKDPAGGADIPLIAQKPTLVRVYVAVDGTNAANNVNARLFVRNQGGQVYEWDAGPITANANLKPHDEDLSHTINFVLPIEDWLTGQLTFEAQVDPDDQIPETNDGGDAESNNTGGTISKPFQLSKTLKIAYIPIHYDPSGCTWPNKDPDSLRIAKAYQWAQKVYPTAKIDYFRWPETKWSIPLRILDNQSACLGNRDEQAEDTLNLELSLRWLLSIGSRPDYVFGWLPDDAVGGGQADSAWDRARPGFGVAAHADDDDNDNGAELGHLGFAHEMGHLLGRRHTNTGECGDKDSETDWPPSYSTAKIQKWGLDVALIPSSEALKDPNHTYDYMSGCWGPNYKKPAWTSPHTYGQVYTQTLKQITTLSTGPLATPQSYFIASGLIFTNNTATLNPIWVITSTIVPSPPPVGTQYCLVAQDASGVALTSHCFNLAFTNYETGQVTNVDGFKLMLPYPSSVARIVLKKSSQELAARSVSAHAPVTTVLSPNGGEIWAASGTQTITWNGSDTDGDPLTYSVLYSPDSSNWLPIGVAITQTQLVVNAIELGGGNVAKVQVLATDGVNTSIDQSDSSFTVGRKRPEAYILSPEGGKTILPGSPLFLEGYAFDLEDGVLDNAAVRWSSDQDGILGTGRSVLALLSQGQHTITLTAMDSDGNLTTATINISVEDKKVYLPIILK